MSKLSSLITSRGPRPDEEQAALLLQNGVDAEQNDFPLSSSNNFKVDVKENASPPPDRNLEDLRLRMHSNDSLSVLEDLRIGPAATRAWLDPREAGYHEGYYKRRNSEGSMPRHRPSEADALSTDSHRSSESYISLSDSNNNNKIFGTFDVFACCLLSIFGAIMFLRLPWIVGQAGVIQALLIMTLASVVTGFTTLSMSAICTNGEIKTGGAYFLISRALGPAIGGSTGILFTIGNAVACSMYLLALSETLVAFFNGQGMDPVTGSEINDVRLFATIAIALQFIMAIFGGLNWVVKTQMILLLLILCAIASFFIGSFSGGEEDDLFYGIHGWTKVFEDNLNPRYCRWKGMDYNFFDVFAVFFPAVTGIMSGANISGELKNPAHNIPTGTLYAIVISWVIYCIMAIFIGGVMGRGEEGCSSKKGLLCDMYVINVISIWSPIVFAGIYAATFSSGLGSLVGAPRILQAVALDNIIPNLEYFAYTNRNGDPIRGYWLSFFIAFACNMIGSLNAVAPLITMFFLMTYTLLNASCFFLSYSKSPGWRPSFKYYSKWTALAGSVFCFGIMFLINWYYALIAHFVGIGLYIYIAFYVDPHVNWGSAFEARQYITTYNALMSLNKKTHIKNFRPVFLILTGEPEKRKNLIQFSQTFRYNYAPIIYGNVCVGDYRQDLTKFREVRQQQGMGQILCDEPVVEGLYDCVVAPTLPMGACMLLQLSGLGRLQPNTVVLGFPENWAKSLHDENNKKCEEIVGIIQDSFLMNMGCMICRNLTGMNWDWETIRPRHKRRPRGVIDVWWLIDDGGLTLLVPYLISRHKFWYWCKLRLFLIAQPGSASDITCHEDYKKILEFVEKFRIRWDVRPEIVDVQTEFPSHETMSSLEEIVGQEIIESDPNPEVTQRWLRVSEIIREKSAKQAALIIMSMPFPQENLAPELYLGLLDVMTRNLPPTVVMRGNSQNVLTFYSD